MEIWKRKGKEKVPKNRRFEKSLQNFRSVKTTTARTRKRGRERRMDEEDAEMLEDGEATGCTRRRIEEVGRKV